MSTNKMDERAVTAFMELFFGDNPPGCEATYITGSDVGGTKVAARFDWDLERPEPRYESVSMAVCAWLEEALKLREPYDLYEELLRGDQGAPARGVTIDPGTRLLVIVDAGHLMCVHRGDWVVYVAGHGFSVMPDGVFCDAWETLR